MKKFVKRVSVAGLVIVGLFFGAKGIGFGGGNGIGIPAFNPIVETADDNTDKNDETVAIIKVEETNITVDGEKCANVEELKDKISKINAKGEVKKYIFEHEYAIKATYDEVKKALIDLEEALNLTIDYNE